MLRNIITVVKDTLGLVECEGDLNVTSFMRDRKIESAD